MKVLVTGATGFAGRWLTLELAAAGHTVIPAPNRTSLDLRDSQGVRRLVDEAAPDAIAHLAAVATPSDATRAPLLAFEVNVGGTDAVIRAAAGRGIPVLVTGSSEVYGRPSWDDLPLTESAPLKPHSPYGLSKFEQERKALELGQQVGVPVLVTRSFNHTGPGQGEKFVVPALASRILRARASRIRSVPVGNLDVARDIGDVRDTVRAYRLLLESLATGSTASGTIVNVATGTATPIRTLFELIASLTGADVAATERRDLVRPNEPRAIVGDPSRLHSLTGWSPSLPIEQTLADIVRSLQEASARTQ